MEKTKKVRKEKKFKSGEFITAEGVHVKWQEFPSGTYPPHWKDIAAMEIINNCTNWHPEERRPR